MKNWTNKFCKLNNLPYLVFLFLFLFFGYYFTIKPSIFEGLSTDNTDTNDNTDNTAIVKLLTDTKTELTKTITKNISSVTTEMQLLTSLIGKDGVISKFQAVDAIDKTINLFGQTTTGGSSSSVSNWL